MKINIGTVNYAKRVKMAALLLLVLTALYTNLTYFYANRRFDPHAIGKDDITLYEERFQELRKVLPERCLVGYVHDEADEVKVVMDYYLTQYALAPNVVVRGTEPELVVGNFSHPGAAEKNVSENLIPLKNFGNGVVLFRKGVR